MERCDDAAGCPCRGAAAAAAAAGGPRPFAAAAHELCADLSAFIGPCRYLRVDQKRQRDLFYLLAEHTGSEEEPPLLLWTQG